MESFLYDAESANIQDDLVAHALKFYKCKNEAELLSMLPQSKSDHVIQSMKRAVKVKYNDEES